MGGLDRAVREGASVPDAARSRSPTPRLCSHAPQGAAASIYHLPESLTPRISSPVLYTYLCKSLLSHSPAQWSVICAR